MERPEGKVTGASGASYLVRLLGAVSGSGVREAVVEVGNGGARGAGGCGSHR